LPVVKAPVHIICAVIAGYLMAGVCKDGCVGPDDFGIKLAVFVIFVLSYQVISLGIGYLICNYRDSWYQYKLFSEKEG